jgi:hypothetical protein
VQAQDGRHTRHAADLASQHREPRAHVARRHLQQRLGSVEQQRYCDGDAHGGGGKGAECCSACRGPGRVGRVR